jgi:hypothetical protein
MTDPSTSLSTNELAARWGLKPAALRHHRRQGTGPAFVTLDRAFLPLGSPYVLYPLASVLAFESAHNITPLN